jgi:uncharacterized protein HemY
MVQERRSLSGRGAALGTGFGAALGAAAMILAAAVLGGCSLTGPRPQAGGEPSSTPSAPGASSASPSSNGSPAPTPPPVPHAPPPPRENHLSPATLSLVTQARSLSSHGDIDGASSTLDRALRIEPNNPLLWIELGRLRLLDSESHQAEGCARKALALASGDHGAQKQAGHLLADALRAQQRNQEAHDVESQPFMR